MNQNKLDSIMTKNRDSGKVIGTRIIYSEILESTMITAKEYAKSGCEEGTTIIAGKQTGGRGRLGRSWYSPSGGLWMSLILYPDLPYDEIPLIL
jgi:BirA family biotin operon repressor/biotin-[acetyl-CoA-carboxylase] ligase